MQIIQSAIKLTINKLGESGQKWLKMGSDPFMPLCLPFDGRAIAYAVGLFLLPLGEKAILVPAPSGDEGYAHLCA